MADLALFAVSAPSLEPFTAQELEHLGLLHSSAAPSTARRSPQDASVGGVAFSGTLRDLYRANLHLRTASRVLVRFGEFYAAAFSELRKKAGRLPWENYLRPGQPVALRVTCHKSRLYHSDAVAERVAGAIADRLGQEPEQLKAGEDDEQPAAQLVVVRLVRDLCTISIDSSGELLHRRGYRLAAAKAPLRETLAAAILIAAGWDRRSPLLDPFCGSGTIAIEAALMAGNIAPGRARRFAFMDWPGFDKAAWRSEVDVGVTGRPAAPRIIASDRDAGAIEAAHANATRAGVADAIEFSRRAVSAIEPPPGPGWIVTNPPYGARTAENRDLRNLYAQFGNALRATCPGWHVAMLAGTAQLQRAVGLEFDQGLALLNGGLKVRLVRGRVPFP